MGLFAEYGYEQTTVEMIAAAAGAGRRTFFDYFKTKAATVWRAFDVEVRALHDQLAAVPDDVPVMAGVQRAVVAVNHYRVGDVEELRTRMRIIGTVPELAASAAVHYDSWEAEIRAFVARRTGLDEMALYPLAVGRATLATCRAAFEHWIANADTDLGAYLDAALAMLGAGFAVPASPTS